MQVCGFDDENKKPIKYCFALNEDESDQIMQLLAKFCAEKCNDKEEGYRDFLYVFRKQKELEYCLKLDQEIK